VLRAMLIETVKRQYFSGGEDTELTRTKLPKNGRIVLARTNFGPRLCSRRIHTQSGETEVVIKSIVMKIVANDVDFISDLLNPRLQLEICDS
jgi:hypothetical protein